jgi:alkylhydroperoxidase/carboxymuconolactone decarboxylase family protein YurZ
MHPLLARYLNLDAAVDVLHREELGQVLKAEERLLAEVARAAPDRRALVLGARGLRSPSPEVQEALLYLAAHAASSSLRDDEELGPAQQRARAALAAEGASEEEIETLIATLVLEEAFGYDEGTERFDRPFFLETLEGVPALATLTRERVMQLQEAFSRTAALEWSEAHRLAAGELIQAAWSEGPEPINPEHVLLALEELRTRLPAGERPRAVVALKRLLAFLHRAGFVGTMRLARLSEAVDGEADAPASGAIN